MCSAVILFEVFRSLISAARRQFTLKVNEQAKLFVSLDGNMNHPMFAAQSGGGTSAQHATWTNGGDGKTNKPLGQFERADEINRTLCAFLYFELFERRTDAATRRVG